MPPVQQAGQVMVEAAGAVADLRLAVGARRLPVFAGMQSAAIVALAEPP